MTWKSLFRFDSYEPRFVIDHTLPEALQSAIDLWYLSMGASFRGDGLVRWVCTHDNALLLMNPELYKPYVFALDHSYELNFQALEQPISKEALTPYIANWLAKTDYPTKPSFDGLAQKGFCVYWVYFRCEEVQTNCYGYLVVIPKWFEVHK